MSTKSEHFTKIIDCLEVNRPGARPATRDAILGALGASWEPPDLIFTYFRTSRAHFQAPWPVWGAAHWRSGHGALVAPEGPLSEAMVRMP